MTDTRPSGRKSPFFRDTRAGVAGGLRVRGWAWSLSMVWVVIGAGGAIYATVALSHPGYQEVLLIPKTIQWPGEPQLIIYAAPIAEVAWGLLSVPVLVAGFVRLRGWRPRNWLRVTGWASSWVAGLVLMIRATAWVAARNGEHSTSGAPRIGELATCGAWLVLGALMTWILAASPARHSDVPSTTKQAIGNAS